jgi:benzoyl-CoA reductase/2-hydroxyglutaryl-CoA dehydratase subunit BcrC/BadD/HgdB
VDKEIYHAMGVFGFYPEHYASLCATQRRPSGNEKYAVGYAEIAEEHGYSANLCGYHRVVMGYVINGDLADGPLGGMAAPDLLVTTSSICDLRMKWWEDMAQRLRVPMFILDRPERNLNGRVETPKPHEVSYYRSQLEDLVAFITDVTGLRYDKDRLNEYMDRAYRTNELRLEVLELRKAVPSPMGSADSFSVLYPAMYCLGKEKAYRFHLALRDEVKARVETGDGQIANERFRLMWCGIPTWFNTAIFNYFEPVGGVFAFDRTYLPYVWPVRMPEDPLTELALRYLAEGTQQVQESVVGDPRFAREYKIDGAVFNSIYTCRAGYLPLLETVRALDEVGVPSVVIDCDFVDERSYSEGQVNTRLDALAERILASKGIRS